MIIPTRTRHCGVWIHILLATGLIVGEAVAGTIIAMYLVLK